MHSTADVDRVFGQRIRQVFDYLKALNEHRYPAIRQIPEQPWMLWLDDLPKHPAIEFPQRVSLAADSEKPSGPEAGSFVLKVRRPQLTTAPPPPDEIRDWLQPGWDDPFRDVERLRTRNERDSNGDTVTLQFDSNSDRRFLFENWKTRREAWRVAELPARKAMELFDRFYALHGRLARESEGLDLIVGDGLLSWQRTDGDIYHPLLLQRVQLIFDAQRPEFCVVDGDQASKFYSGLFQAIGDVDAHALKEGREQFDAGGYHPLDEDVTGLLEGFANRVSAQGSFIGKGKPERGAIAPKIGRAPALFLRNRTRGFGTAIDQVLNSLKDRGDFCDALRNIVGVESPVAVDEGKVEALNQGPERPTPDVLFGKTANPEQHRIATAIDKHGSVLVQGPPGTGKSHTIANLIGHLLAKGQSVLVTSHTTKALRVLREHLVEELRPLCVSVLDNDLESRRQLEESIQGIDIRLSDDADDLERQADRLDRERRQLIDTLRGHQLALQNARAAEYRDVVYAGISIPPSDAARRVAAGVGIHDWLPGPIAPGAPCPLTVAEVKELYETNSATTPFDERFVDRALPEDIPTPEEAAQMFRAEGQLAKVARLDRNYWREPGFTANHVRELGVLVAGLSRVVDEFAKLDGWKITVVDAGRASNGDSPWQHLIAKIDQVADLAAQSSSDVVTYRPEIGDDCDIELQHAVALELHEFLARGGKLRLEWLPWRKRWRNASSSWKVRGKPPRSVDEIEALIRLLSLRIARNELRLIWDSLMAPEGAPASVELGDRPEQTCAQFVPMLRQALTWWFDEWCPLEKRIIDFGFQWSRLLSEQPPMTHRFGEMRRIVRAIRDRLIPELERTKAHLELVLLRRRLDEVLKRLANNNRPESTALRSALENRDPNAYAIAVGECDRASQRRKITVRRRELLTRLTERNVAGAWATAIRNREGVHGSQNLPGDVASAWEWRQLSDELDRRSTADLEEIGRQIESVQDLLRTVTNDLIDRRAWAAQIRRTGLVQRQALKGWLSIIHRIGKGFGQRVPLLRKEAQQKMEECRAAVPVWIMPLSRVVENFDFSKPRFDVVIIDEASQCDVMALIALSLARKVVIVGDDKQVSPIAVGQRLDIIDNLIRLHLQGIPNSVLYDGRMSVYDLAKQSFLGLICLVEHFRCVPDIIQFSNHFSYNGAIKPLREGSTSPLVPHVVPYRVEGATRDDGKINCDEALTIASLIVAACEHPPYAKQSFGAISLLGEEQAIEIDRLLRQHMSTDEYARRRIICGNSAQFQGDERDVIFLSMVQSPDAGPLPMLDRPEFRQRYNVAASRARNQMWVVYSLNHSIDLKPGDIRRTLIEHALDPQAVTRELDGAAARTESHFEQQVYERLVRLGFNVTPQWPVGRYRIDLVVQSGDRRLAIECDGDRFHPIEQLGDDMARQAILERLGWRFIRVRGTAYYRDMDGTTAKLVKTLENLGIVPDTTSDGRPVSPVAEGLSAEIIRRAAAIREHWRTPELDAAPKKYPDKDKDPPIGTGGLPGNGDSSSPVKPSDDVISRPKDSGAHQPQKDRDKVKTCPKCGKPLSVRKGPFRQFYGCS